MKKKPIQEEKLFHIVLGALREGVNIVDENGNIIYSNKSSANYVFANAEEMVGQHITKYYPKAALMEVLNTKNPVFDKKIVHDYGRTFIVNAEPIYIDNKFWGGVATFRDITEIEELSKRLESLEIELALSKVNDVFNGLIGRDDSLKEAINRAQRSIASIGGPRHSIIVGETGTGKTMLAKAMHFFAEKIGVIKTGAPFIEVNCAQFTNPDIAAMEIFGTEKGAFTGASDKVGLLEMANGGIFFLDEAQALGQHQAMLLKVIESGRVRRIGGRNEREVNVIIITASSKNLKKEFIPELYQRLAQYQIELPPLRERSCKEKEQMLEYFVGLYKIKSRSRYNIDLNVKFSDEAKGILLNANYERNIRQFRDIVNAAIDSAAPLINNVTRDNNEIKALVDIRNIPFNMLEQEKAGEAIEAAKEVNIDELIVMLSNQGLGPRKIANELKKKGFSIEYYQVAYKLKKARKKEAKSIHKWC